MPPPLTLDVVDYKVVKTKEYKRPKRKLAYLLYTRTPVWVRVTAKHTQDNGFESFRIEYDIEAGDGAMQVMSHLIPCELVGDSIPDLAVQMMGLFNDLKEMLPDEDQQPLLPV